MSADTDTELGITPSLLSLGTRAISRIRASHVLVVGCNGVGVEVAKCLLLNEVGRISLWDDATVTISDLGSNFCLSESHMGANRAESSCEWLKNISAGALVGVSDTATITADTLTGVDAVVSANGHLSGRDVDLDALCREAGVKFIRATAHGLTTSVFVDVGESHSVTQATEEGAVTYAIESVTQASPGVVTLSPSMGTGEPPQLDTGDTVTFAGVRGMQELNDTTATITRVSKYCFSIGDTSEFGAYTGGGTVTTSAGATTVSHKALADTLTEPGELPEVDYAFWGRPLVLHAVCLGLDRFQSKTGNLPGRGSADDAAKLLELCKAAYSEIEGSGGEWEDEWDKLVSQISYGSSAVLAPTAAYVGGVAAVEAIKALSGLYMPLNQWLYAEFTLALPAEWPLSADAYAPQNSRFDDQIAVFGSAFQETLANLNVAVFGVTGLGAEFAKVLTLMGVACGSDNNNNFDVDEDDTTMPGGLLTFVDGTRVEPVVGASFYGGSLFPVLDADTHAKVVAAGASHLNDALRTATAEVDIVTKEGTAALSDRWWRTLDVAVVAGTTKLQRERIDGRCRVHRKSSVHAGVLGAKGHTQAVVPHVTESYCATEDPADNQVPMDVIANFPCNTTMCIDWAQYLFNEIFTEGAQHAANYAEQPDEYTAQLRKEPPYTARARIGPGARPYSGALLDYVGDKASKTWDDCVEWAVGLAKYKFGYTISELIAYFPADARSHDNKPFWSGHKRFPTVIGSAEGECGELVERFVLAAATLRAEVMGVEPGDACAVGVDDDYIEFEAAKKAEESAEERPIEEFIDALSPPGDQTITPIKLDVTHNKAHLEFVTVTANLRATNYGIEKATPAQVRNHMGKIHPSLPGTSATMVGAACVELYKLCAGVTQLDTYRNMFANLAVPIQMACEPVPPKPVRSTEAKTDPRFPSDFEIFPAIVAVPEGHTEWDTLHVSASLTVQELIDKFKADHGVVLTAVCAESVYPLYLSALPGHSERLGSTLLEIVDDKIKNCSSAELTSGREFLELECVFEVEDGSDAVLPAVLLDL